MKTCSSLSGKCWANKGCSWSWELGICKELYIPNHWGKGVEVECFCCGFFFFFLIFYELKFHFNLVLCRWKIIHHQTLLYGTATISRSIFQRNLIKESSHFPFDYVIHRTSGDIKCVSVGECSVPCII